MSIIPTDRYDGVRTLADTVIDLVFGEPLRWFQRKFQSRKKRDRATRRRAMHVKLKALQLQDRLLYQTGVTWGVTYESMAHFRRLLQR